MSWRSVSETAFGLGLKTYRNLPLHFPDTPVQLRRNPLLHVSPKHKEPLTQVAIDHALDRNIVTSIHQMVASRQWWIFGTQVTFQALEEVHIFAALEGSKYTNGTLQSSPQQHLTTSTDQLDFLY